VNMHLWLEQALKWLIAVGPKVVVTVILTLIALRASRSLSDRFLSAFKKAKPEMEMQKRADTLSSLMRYVATVIIIVVSSIMILDEFGIDIGPILAAAGIVGLAVGFGAQHLVQDVISGFFILIEDQIRVGDIVQIAGKSGLVERVNLRMTTLRDLSGNVHFVRNGQIDVVTNMTKEYSYYVFDISISYREDIEEVTAIIKEIDEQMRNDPQFKDFILEPIDVLGLDKFADSAIIIRARVKTKPIRQWKVAREFNRRLKKEFDERKIEMPYPHLMLYMGQDKKGDSAPLNVSLTGKSEHLSE